MHEKVEFKHHCLAPLVDPLTRASAVTVGKTVGQNNNSRMFRFIAMQASDIRNVDRKYRACIASRGKKN